MALAEAHALLHRLHREADGAGRIISTTADYGAAVKVLAEAMAIATDKAVPPATRRVVEAVQELHAADAGAQITTRAVARKLGTSPSTTSHDVHDALDRGFLTNVSRAPNKFDLKPADPLPEQGEALPTKEELDAACSGRVRSVFGSQPNTQSRSQSEKSGRVRRVRSNPEGAEETEPDPKLRVLDVPRMSEVEPQPPPTCEVCHKQMWWHGSTYGYGCPDSAAGEKECRSKLYRPYREGDRWLGHDQRYPELADQGNDEPLWKSAPSRPLREGE